ncbi:MAG: ABC transporter ATP-binding protein [Bacteroidia bacterium]|nr:ABC transporter ATP-binding protein [Bacteroidia bacterium]MCZ2276383.1 ABC transporter ATP-binding protein [Bacteroidia bacterium]
MSEKLLEVRQLCISFQSAKGLVPITTNLSFSINKGEIVGLAGESGAGKSVTALALLRLLPFKALTSGEIFFGNLAIHQSDEKLMQQIRGKRISLILQESLNVLNPVFTCGEQLLEIVMQHQKVKRKEAYNRSIELLNKTGLQPAEHVFKSYPHQLSGGQRQRVLIAIAICGYPELLIADEPTSALDSSVQRSIIQLLQMLCAERKMAMILISHNLHLLSCIADRLVIMHKGKMVESGNVKELLTHPGHSYTKKLLACNPPLTIRLRRLNEGEEVSSGTAKDHYFKLGELEARTEKIYQTQPFLQVRSVSKNYAVRSRFGQQKRLSEAVRNVSFEMYPGETLGIIGESGSGKSTLAQIVAGLIKPDSGEVLLNGNNLHKLTRKEDKGIRQRIQIIFQDSYSSLNPYTTVGYLLMEPMKVHKLYKNHKYQKEKAVALLEQVGLTADYLVRFPHELSGGQQQRIAIARALTVNPEFIICDEIVSFQDVCLQSQILNLINQLKNSYGFSCLFISHDLSVIRFMSDRVGVIHQGEIIETALSDRFFKYPETEIARSMLSSAEYFMN